MIRAIFCALVLSALTGCGGTNLPPGVDAAMRDFHEKSNEAKYEEIYTDASESLKLVSKLPDFSRFLATVREVLGRQKSSSVKSVKVSRLHDNTVITVFVITTFERGVGTECFTYVTTPSSCRLQGYYIKSPQLKVQ